MERDQEDRTAVEQAPMQVMERLPVCHRVMVARRVVHQVCRPGTAARQAYHLGTVVPRAWRDPPLDQHPVRQVQAAEPPAVEWADWEDGQPVRTSW